MPKRQSRILQKRFNESIFSEKVASNLNEIFVQNIFTPNIQLDENTQIEDILEKIYYFHEDANQKRYYKSELVFTILLHGIQFWAYIIINNDEGSCSTCGMHSSHEQKMYIAETFNNLITHQIGAKHATHILPYFKNYKNILKNG